MQKDFLH
jgi:hypothetical protein